MGAAKPYGIGFGRIKNIKVSSKGQFCCGLWSIKSIMMLKESVSVPFSLFDRLDDLDTGMRELFLLAEEAGRHAYAPYSRFMVGAALLLEDGTRIPGGNQENASYPLCMCAERVALYAAAALRPGKKILQLAVTARRQEERELVPATPCGGCRQVIFEFEQRQNSPIRILLMGPGRKYHLFDSAARLLPLAFDRESL